MDEKFAALTSFPNEPIPPPSPLVQVGLHDLREKIKEAMIPLLIQIFRLKQENLETKGDESEKKLLALQEDLKQLSLWTQSCLSQIEKALAEGEPPSLQKLSIEKGQERGGEKLRSIFSFIFRRAEEDT